MAHRLIPLAFQSFACLMLIGDLTISPAVSAEVAENRVDFNRQIRPILSDNCYHCHGPDEDKREADLRLDTLAGATADLGGYAALVPGNAKKSELLARLTAEEPDERMPPADSGKELGTEQIELIRTWIVQGADWPEHWSFVAPRRSPVPPKRVNALAHNEIDRFVLAKLVDKQLQPSPRADDRTLIRRLTLDLTGLPPSREEIQAFLNDGDDNRYEKLVDRLLNSLHYGERMALAWMDQARYADTNGYSIDGGRHMWLWRDWVIHAYNQNMPFDQFATEQLAGDLLPDATTDQIVATGFNRNHMITHEGGTIPQENLTNYAVDRVKTTAEVFLGLTMGCAQCHDHKYDPLTQADYYRFFAFFNTLSDRGLDGNAGQNAGPTVRAMSVLGQDEKAQIEQQLAELREHLEQPLESQSQWEQAARSHLDQRGKDLKLHPLKIVKVTSPNRAIGKLDDEYTINLNRGGSRSPSFLLKCEAENVTGLRVEFLPDPKLPNGGIGQGTSGLPGSFLLTSFSASADALPSDQVDLNKMTQFRSVTASNAHEQFPPANCLDARDHNGWSPHPHNEAAQHITFNFRQPLNASETPYITTLLVWGGGPYGNGAKLTPGRLRFYALTGTDDGTNLPEDVQAILRTSSSKREAKQQQRLRSYYATVAPELNETRHAVANLTERLTLLSKPHNTMRMNVADKPRKTHILNRGQYDQPGEEVTPGVPQCLPPLPRGVTADRLALARWLVQPDHPLTARVAVNRVWQLFFGEGIVSSSADFGSQGQPPTHPELLDTLAVDFVESGWDVKRLIKKIVMSATYQQSSHVTLEQKEFDPGNQWLSRGPRFRLQAEYVRDTTLHVSGLLVNRLGGPSVKPYQPPGLWREVSHFGSSPATAQVFVQDHGEKLYRRSMYTYWKRTVPPPAMVSFDAPNREICTMKRSVTNTPLQALVLLNDPQFVEASRAFAERILTEGPESTEERIAYAFELATARLPSQQETAVLKKALERSLREFKNNPDQARAYLQVGESRRDDRIDPAEHAAWAGVASLILNLSETITKG
jgi:mono/diheme cytochrome c family protein